MTQKQGDTKMVSAKLAIAGIAFLTYSDTAIADTERCARLGALAENIMFLRQMEQPMSKVRNIPLHDETPDMRATVEEIVARAYALPSNDGEEDKVEQRIFRNNIEADCFAEKL